MTWEIVAGLITIGGFLITVVTLGFKLSAVLTRLDVTVKGVSENLTFQRKQAEREHGEIHGELDRHEDTLQKHEMRIHDLERGQK